MSNYADEMAHSDWLAERPEADTPDMFDAMTDEEIDMFEREHVDPWKASVDFDAEPWGPEFDNPPF